MNVRKVSELEMLDYEIRASLWAPLIGNNWLQERVASYFVWKTKRKYMRYLLTYDRRVALTLMQKGNK